MSVGSTIFFNVISYNRIVIKKSSGFSSSIPTKTLRDLWKKFPIVCIYIFKNRITLHIFNHVEHLKC